MSVNFEKFHWLHKPSKFEILENEIVVITEPKTDYWQRTYYGFQFDNAPSFLIPLETDFEFRVTTTFDSKAQFDQCGVLLYEDSDNWFKSSVEYEDETISRLGSVVTSFGFSDWATRDIPTNITSMHYRLSRRGPDFLMEFSFDGQKYEQMRLFHFHKAGKSVNVGIYACSPKDSSYTARFTNFHIGDNRWQEH